MEEWDSIDWDERIEDIVKGHQKQQPGEIQEHLNRAPAFQSEDDGNYYDTNVEKKRLQDAQTSQKKAGLSNENKRKHEIFNQPYSLKSLKEISDHAKCQKNVHNLIYETFGQFERFLMTHQEDLTNEALVELLNIDVNLLQIPFHSHNQLLLSEIVKIDTFWMQIVQFLEDFFENKQENVKFLLSVDVNGFIENIEHVFHNILVNNLFNANIELVFGKILDVLQKSIQWSHFVKRLQKYHTDFSVNIEVNNIYNIYPSLDDLKSRPQLLPNIINGCYQSVSHYLEVQIPLLKEDFVSKLREGVQQLRSMESIADEVLRTSNLWIHPQVKIKIKTDYIFNMKCSLVFVKLNNRQKPSDWNRRFFNGQMLCFSSSKDFNDLIIAIVAQKSIVSCLNCSTTLWQGSAQGETYCYACGALNAVRQESNFVKIEIIKTENISDIINKDLVMIESTTFFEPYHRVFNELKCLNELNFPFKDQIIEVKERNNFPNYQRSRFYSYNKFSFLVENLNEWPSNIQLNLELKQLQAIKKAVTTEFTLIKGPPGTGKTFVGLEILKVLLENTNEKILILTQTNNALDKFLLGASKFTDDIARMGSQSKSDELKKFMIKPTIPLESKKYMKKLQFQLKDEVAKLMTGDQNNQEIHRKISLHHRLIEEINQLSSYYSIRDKRIVGMTTSFAAKNSSINKMLKPGIVIVEEASEVLESHVLVSLTKHTKQLVMIGDHQQLKPLTSSHDLAKNFFFNMSLFERLKRNNFDPSLELNVQMRMKPEICDLVRWTIYKDLRDGENVANYPIVKGMTTSLYCLNHSHLESVGDGETSKENTFEAEYIVNLYIHLINKGNDKNQITILTAYAAQAQKIRDKFVDFFSADAVPRVAVLDAYQGEESDIILLSLVRSNTRRDIGFLATENRIAVLLSRAKFGFYIIANMNCLADASPTWRMVRDILEEKQAIGEAIPNVNFNV